MNEQPHIHKLTVENHRHSWWISYGDQSEFCDRPARWLWDSDEAYTKRSKRVVKDHIARIIRNHDRASQAAPLGLMNLPELREGTWGSEQLT